MAKPMVILVHGSGAYSENWADKLIARLDELAATFPRIVENGAFSEQVVLKPLNYDKVFEGLLERWERQGQKLDGLLEETDVKLPRIASFLRDSMTPPDERGFIWTHVLDPVAYRGIPLVRDEVRANVLADLVSAINQHKDEHPGGEISIMGQSLGTIVLHDALHQMGSGEAGDVWGADRHRFSNVFQVANASRLGPPSLIDIKPTQSLVRPLSASPGNPSGAVCGFFYNFRNVWDPVANWQRFNPTGWGAGFFDITVRHVHQVNVHGFIHYMEHPDVHIRLFRALLGSFVIPGVEWQQRVAEFPDLVPGSCGDTLSALMNKLDQLRTAVSGGKLDDVAMALLEFYRAIKTAKEGCEELYNRVDGWL